MAEERLTPRLLSIARACAQAHAIETAGWAARMLPSVRKLAVLTTRPAASSTSDVLATKVNKKHRTISYQSSERKVSSPVFWCLVMVSSVFPGSPFLQALLLPHGAHRVARRGATTPSRRQNEAGPLARAQYRVR